MPADKPGSQRSHNRVSPIPEMPVIVGGIFSKISVSGSSQASSIPSLEHRGGSKILRAGGIGIRLVGFYNRSWQVSRQDTDIGWCPRASGIVAKIAMRPGIGQPKRKCWCGRWIGYARGEDG